MSKYTVILFYKYVRIDDPALLLDQYRELCNTLGLKGRMLIAEEGINATLEGTNESIDLFLKSYLEDSRFAETHIKRSEGDGNSFQKLIIKVRNEIVSLGLPKEEDIDPSTTTGIHLSPEELKKWFEDKKEFVIVDMRNDYEHQVGHFEGSVLPPLSNFRDLPKVSEELESLRNKTVLTVCTGGVRCEKASGYLVKKGFKDVYQLDGGIVSYMEKFKDNKEFRGSLYVFDNRITMAFADPSVRGVVGNCKKCAAACERYVNCANNLCHLHFIACMGCSADNGKVCCGPECEAALSSVV